MTTTAAATTYSPDDLAPRLDAVETAVQELRAEQRQTNARLDAVEGRLGALAERTATIEGRLTTIETNLSDLRSELRSDIGLLHTRLDAMQQTLGARLDNMQQTTDTRLDNMHQETNGRIERVFWAIVGAGVAFVVVGGGIIGALLAVAI